MAEWQSQMAQVTCLDQKQYLVKPLGSEHEVGDEWCKPCGEGEYLFLVVFLVHHNHDLWQSHVDGFVVAIFIEFLKLVSGT